MGKFVKTQKVQAFLRTLSTSAKSITEATLAVPAGAAGTVVDFYLTWHPVTSQYGDDIGGYDDSSLVLTGTAFDTEVSAQSGIGVVADADLANGEYWVDYMTGHCRGKKASNATDISATYNYFIEDVAFSGSVTIPADMNIAKVGNTAVHAPNAAIMATGVPVMPARYMATPPTLTDTFASPLLLDSKGNLKTRDAVPTTITEGTKNVTTAGVAVALGTTLATKSIYIKANIGNTGNIYVGGSGTSSATGIPLAAGDDITLEIADRATVYLDADVNGEGVGYLILSI